jgi:hypothetical protein
MTLQLEINESSPILKQLKHLNTTDNKAISLTLISGIAGKKIRIWRMLATCGTAAKSCEILSGTDPFITLYGQEHILKSCDGVPVFTCSSGEDFKITTSEAQITWNFYVVYSIN